MAAVDLSAVTNRPYCYTLASVGTTWQQYILPGWARKATVQGDAALYVGVIGAETPADGGAVGTHRWPLAANAALSVPFRADGDSGGAPLDVTRATSVFVAAQSGTATVYIWLDPAQE